MTETNRAYDAFAERVLETGILGDPWVDGTPRFRAEPLVISEPRAAELAAVAEAVASVYDEMVRMVGREPALLDEFFALPAHLRAMWIASQPLWHGIARADVFETEAGLVISELNSDTPTGQAEAVLLSAMTETEGARDPNAGLRARFVGMVEHLARVRLLEGSPRTAALLYPTEMSEDLALVRLYRAWLGEAGWNVVLGSPFNLGPGTKDGGVSLFGEDCAVVLRHYKTDWWAERLPVWDDEEPALDAAPLVRELRLLLEASLDRKAVVVNPFAAALPQNKRSMAFLWEHIDRFSERSAEIIRRHVPETCRLEAMHLEQLAVEREAWVLKSDYGAEGEEVIVGATVSEDVWRASLAHALPSRWVVQRRFVPVEKDGIAVNHGVFLVGGEASGLFVRLESSPNDVRARTAPVLIAS